MIKVSQTPKHGKVKPGYKMLDKQQYRAVVKSEDGDPLFMSIQVYRNRTNSSWVNDSAVDIAKQFIIYEFKAIGFRRYKDGEYEYEYTGPAPFYDKLRAIYRCCKGRWVRVTDGIVSFTESVPEEVRQKALIQV